MGWAVCGRSHGSRVYNSSPNSTINPGIATASPSIFGRRKPSMISLHTGTGRRERGTRVSDRTLIGVSPDKPEQKPDQRSRRQLKRRSESIEKIVFATEGEFQQPTTNLDSIDYPTRTSCAFND
ncbi:BnaA06g13120D [Brassica napus]|uniref:BnaA06g13120D protein n=1 Tax=Brassica napus TaxID=3708 RepID=A0A078GJJ9_BRANA|nr:BnaA06g13120D [Brassica napus]